MAQQIQIRRDNSTNWASVNPTLAQGELGFETNTNKLKIGDGTTAWNSLAYYYTPNSMVSLLDVTFTSLVSGQVPVANASGIFLNQSLASLVNELVSFASLGSLAVMNQLSFTSLLNQPSLSSLAFQATIDYTTAQLTNKPALGSLAVMNQLSFTSLTNQPSLSSLAFQATIDYTSAQLTNKPALGSLAVMDQLSFTSLLNQPSLGSLAFVNSLTKTDVGLGNVTNDAQLKIASNLSDLNNIATARGNLSLGSLAVLNTITQAFLPSSASYDIIFANALRASNVSIGTLSFTSISTPSTINHNQLGQLTTGDVHTQYALLAGRTGGQSFYGGNASGNRLYLYGTTTANGDIFIQNGGGQTMIGVNGTFDSNETLHVYKSLGSVGGTNVNFNTSKTVAGGFNYGLYNKVDISVGSGTTDSVQGLFNYVNNSNLGTVNFVEAFTQRIDNTGTGSIGEASNIKIFTPTSNGTITTLYGIYLEPQTGTGIATGWSIYADGGKMFHRDPMQIGNTTFGAAVAYLDVRQLSTTVAYPTLRLEQSDLSEEFIQFQTTIGTGNPIVASSTATTFSHKIRVSVNGTFKFLYAYNG